MTTTEPTTAQASDAALSNAIQILHAELARSDNKASLLLALAGAALAGVLSTAGSARIPTVSQVLGGFAAGLLLAAVLVLLSAVRPRLAGSGWPTWGSISLDELHQRIAAGHRADEAQYLARAAHAKFRRVQIGIDLIRCGLVVLAVAAVLAAAL
ncbi:Pycsar system effector family protein [Streptomyces parvulus]|uniref:Pycsar system effector family protein n=1 Tax=Streptomyces parvulus TaxID=146923 RepID=UPI0033B8F20B